MREMWQLPRTSVWGRARKTATVVALAWALVAVPLTLWMAMRAPAPAPTPAQRPLTAIESAAVRYGAQALLRNPVTITYTVTSPMAQLQVEETIDPTRGISHGEVRSGSQTAELLAVDGRVLLRGGSAFWSTLGVPTAEKDWIDIGDRLGTRVTFPLAQAADALVPGPESRIDSAPEGATTTTFRNPTVVAVFGSEGITTLTLSDRTGALSRPSGDALAKLAGTAPPDRDAKIATLAGSGGSLTVTPTTTTTSEAPDPPQ